MFLSKCVVIFFRNGNGGVSILLYDVVLTFKMEERRLFMVVEGFL